MSYQKQRRNSLSTKSNLLGAGTEAEAEAEKHDPSEIESAESASGKGVGFRNQFMDPKWVWAYNIGPFMLLR